MLFNGFCEKRWKSLYYRSKSCFFPKIDENRCTVVQNRSKSMKIVVLSLHCRSKSFKIDEHRCTVVQNHLKSMKIVVLWFKIVQSDALPAARPSALRSSALRPSVRWQHLQFDSQSFQSPAKTPIAKTIYENSRSTAIGRLLLVIYHIRLHYIVICYSL